MPTMAGYCVAKRNLVGSPPTSTGQVAPATHAVLVTSATASGIEEVTLPRVTAVVVTVPVTVTLAP